MLFLTSPINNVSAQETPGHKLLYCFAQAKHRLQYLTTFTFFSINKSKNDCENNVQFTAQETPAEKFLTDLQLRKLSSSVVSGRPNRDCND